MNPAIIAALISAAASIGGGLLGGSSGGPTPIQGQQQELIDQLIASLGGNGPYSDLFKTDEDAFQKSIVDPAMSRFENTIAPGIQQGFISSGLQRGTGLDDTLSRAGVDLNQMINQDYMKFQQGGQDRMQSIIQSILGMGAGSQPGLSMGQKLGQAAGGYLSSDSFSDSLENIMKNYNKPGKGISGVQGGALRPGYQG